jgi:hypothetical protein
MKTNFLTVLLACCLFIPGFAGNDESDLSAAERNYPVPQRTEKLLFYVQRTHNRNTVIYELNCQPDGKVDKKEPLHPSWIRYEEGGVRKELSFIQNRVYGLDVRVLEHDTYLVRFRSYKKRDIYLMRSGKNNSYKAMIKINGKMAELTSFFVCSVTNALGIPSTVKYIDISGLDPATGVIVNERVIP